jgi:hypothetical protein
MSSLVALIGFLILVLGLAVAVLPAALREILHRFLESRWLYWVSGVRVLVGAILVIAASSTAFPGFVRALGVIFIVAGVSIPLLGEERVDRIAEWWLRQSDWMLRAWGVLASVLGALVAWAGL